VSDPYSPLKALRHLDIVDGIRHARPVRPAHVQMVLSDYCNQGCLGCAYRTPDYTSAQLFHVGADYNPRRFMPSWKAREIIDDCAEMGVRGIQFTGGGEPTAHAGLHDALCYAHDKGLACALVSNGVALAKDALSEVVARTCSWVRISIDAGTRATYAETRRVSGQHWDHALEAVQNLRRHRDRLGTECVVGVGFVVYPYNWREIYSGAILAKGLGADNVRISAMFSAADDEPFQNIHEEAAELARKAESLSGEGFQVINRFGARLDDLKQRRPDYDRCGYQHFTTYIGADLNVYRCCVYAYNERGKVGSLDGRRFKDLWMSQERVEDMHSFNARQCDRCQFNGINRTLAYATAPESQLHEEFV
jgi:MoaA/NifB/PqqE/SkfB family radical SAM enzyme